ncbi:histidinol-phosphate transaminase [Stygiolobus caldivivus]|uniref:Histidinol-phosphate transaminase n=1 Tax=Stygiolobus caldivivus TaxID=2824673 RepID=A0A8D5U8L4_9CREN|nr:histidinol-phosphate transaminase [Stygiolobus caldivivus]BCU71358.1 histidinol-phosphate transaminase [Stygiolobus caldivivus]
MHLNESPYSPPPHILDAIQKYLQYANRYQHPELTQRFSELAAEYNKVEPENIFPTPGGDGALRSVFYNLAQPGDKVITNFPAYSMYKVYSSVRGLKHVKVKLIEGEEWWYEDRDTLVKESKDARLVVIDNPNNPTGSPMLDEELVKELASNVKGFIVIDEAYYEFYGKTFARIVYEYPNVLIVRTLSKAFSMASLRVGYIIGNEDLIKVLKKTSTPFDVSLPGLIGGIKALEDPSYVRDVVNKINVNKEYLLKELRKFGLKVFNSYTNFLFVKDNRDLLTPLMARSIAIRNLISGYYRISIGTKEQCELLIKVLGEILEDSNTK